MIDVRAIACALGGQVIGRDAVAAPGPGHSPKDRSLIIKLAPGADDGFVVYSHSGDGWIECRDYVRERLGLPAWQPGNGHSRRVYKLAAIAAKSERPEWSEDDLVRIKRAVAIWDESANPRRTTTEKYFATRKLVLTDDIAGNVLRFHPRCPWRDENTGTTLFIPALIAAFRSIDDDSITGIHRIRLDQPERWPKAERRMFGIVQRAAVKLDQASDTLHIGEGIETCLAARILGHAPAWALGSAGGISFFPLIPGVERLCILGENDTTNAQMARICGQRWHNARRAVEIVLPEIGNDINDELMAQ